MKNNPLCTIPFYGWSDENVENPKKSGNYLCLANFENSENYEYIFLNYDLKTKCWDVADNCAHILWCDLLKDIPNPTK